MDNARMNSSNSMHPSCKTHKHDPIKSHVLFTCWLAFNVWVSFNSKKSMDRFIQWIKLLFRPLGAPQSAAKQRTLLPAYRSTSANLSFNEVANDVAKVRGNESFLLPAAKDKRTAHSSADKAKVKGCEYFVDAPASKERKTLWIFFYKKCSNTNLPAPNVLSRRKADTKCRMEATYRQSADHPSIRSSPTVQLLMKIVQLTGDK